MPIWLPPNGTARGSSKPWAFDHVRTLVERILHLYAEQLLMSLPGVHVSSRCVTELVTRYREATKEMVTAARALHRAEGHGGDDDLLALRIEAEATASVWAATHRLMVAAHVDLMYGNGVDAHPLEIVLVAEMHVEQLVGDVEADEI